MTPEKAKNIIRGCLVAHGFSLLPKGDGRVEIPQKLIQLLPWKATKEVYVFPSDGGLLVSADPELDRSVGKITLNNGRVRLPYGILKELGLDKKALVASLGEDNTIFIKHDFYIHRLNKPLNELPSELAVRFAQVLMGQEDILEKEVVEENPEVNLILPNTRRPITFRPLQDPYRFRGHWNDLGDNGQIVIGGFSRHTSVFYLIGGYEKLGMGQVRAGYLLASDVLCDTLRLARQRALDKGLGNEIEWIIKFDPSIREEFRVFNTPSIAHEDEQKIAKLFNAESNRDFLLKIFPQMKMEMISKITTPPLVINNINYRR